MHYSFRSDYLMVIIWSDHPGGMIMVMQF